MIGDSVGAVVAGVVGDSVGRSVGCVAIGAKGFAMIGGVYAVGSSAGGSVAVAAEGSEAGATVSASG